MEESLIEGQKRFNSRLDKLKRTNKESRTLHGKIIYRKVLKQFIDGVKYLQNKNKGMYAADWQQIRQVKPLLIAHLTLITILDTISSRQRRTSVAVKIGQKIIDEINFKTLKEKHPKWWRNVSKNVGKRVSYGYKRNYAVRAATAEFGPNWMVQSSVTLKTHIGLSLIELFRQVSGLIEYSRNRVGKGRWEYVVLPTKAAFDWIDRVNKKAELISPAFLPMTDKPLDWKTLDKGGYDFPPDVNWSFIKGKDRYDPESNFSELYSAANLLQKTPYRINSALLSVSKVEYSNKVLSEDHERDKLKESLKETNYTLVYRQCQAKYHRDRLKALPERIRIDNTLQVANRFVDSQIYLPVRADFRGRLYYAPHYLTPQGSDLARSLLKFATPTPTKNCEQWFLIGGANAFGIKGTLDFRADWIIQHESRIRLCADDPLTHKWWQEADSPYQFLAFCLEFNDWIDNRLTFKTQLPVRLDHHASGLQIVACLNNDPKLMRLTNVAECKEPNDVYEEILKELKELLRTGRPEDYRWAAMLDRKLVKCLTISLMYGSSYFGLQKQVIDWYVELPEDVFKREIYKEAHQLIQKYYSAIDKVSTTPLSFLRDMQLKQKTEAVSFKSPSGFTIINDYKKYKSQRVKATVNGETAVARVNVEAEGLNMRAARQALAANMVHMYDAAIMHHVLNSRPWESIQTMHDCYGVPPQDCEELQVQIKNSMSTTLGLDLPEKMWYTCS